MKHHFYKKLQSIKLLPESSDTAFKFEKFCETPSDLVPTVTEAFQGRSPGSGGSC